MSKTLKSRELNEILADIGACAEARAWIRRKMSRSKMSPFEVFRELRNGRGPVISEFSESWLNWINERIEPYVTDVRCPTGRPLCNYCNNTPFRVRVKALRELAADCRREAREKKELGVRLSALL